MIHFIKKIKVLWISSPFKVKALLLTLITLILIFFSDRLISIFLINLSNELIRGVIAISFSLINMIIIMSIYMTEKTIKSIRLITYGAQKLSEGDLSYPVEEEGQDDTKYLAYTLNQMSHEFRETINTLSTERNTLTAVLETMNDGVILVNSGRIEVINPAAFSILGIPEEENTATDFMSLVRDHELNDLLNESVETGLRKEKEVHFSQTNKYLHIIASPGTGNEAKKILLTFHDLTEARRIDEIRREFVSNVSHELRTPLASIKAMVETLEGGALNDESYAIDFLNRIHITVDSMSDIVSDLLTLSKAESIRGKQNLSPVSIEAITRISLNLLEEKAREKNINLHLETKTNSSFVQGEETQLQITIKNLVDNAIKFTPDNGDIYITIQRESKNIITTVKDTGPGISSEHINHIFERFYKADQSRHDVGTGLGLSIVRHIIESIDGNVSVQSTLGDGATFKVVLPSAKENN